MSASVRQQTSVRAVFDLAWPIMVSMLSYTMMSLVDTLFVARLGTDPLAAVGLAVIAVLAIQSLGAGIISGVRVLVSQAVGAGNEHLAHRFAWQGIWLGLVIGIGMALISWWPPAIFDWLGATTSMGLHANAFFSIRALGIPIVLLNLAITCWFQGRGDTRTPMRATLWVNGLNIALDPVFIFGLGPAPELGTGGAAFATVLSLCVGTVYLGWRAQGILRTVDSRPDPALVASLVRMGGPIGMRYFLEMGSYLVFTAIITRVGSIELAAHVVVVRICMVSFLPGHAVGDACGVLVGQFVGAAQTDRARLVVRSGIKLGICVMLGWGMVFCTVPDLLVAPFQIEASAVNVAIQLLYIAALFQVFDAVVMVLQGSMSGAGDTRFVMVSTLITSWLIKVPLGAYLALGVGMGAVGSWLGFMVELIILSLICALRMRSDAWLSHRALEEVSR